MTISSLAHQRVPRSSAEGYKVRDGWEKEKENNVRPVVLRTRIPYILVVLEDAARNQKVRLPTVPPTCTEV